MPNIYTSGPPITNVNNIKLFGVDENGGVGWIFSNSLAPVVHEYAAGIEITQYNQLVRDENGEFWRVSGQVDLPYVTTGAGIPEDDALVPVGDAVLRQDLADPDKGALMVRGAAIYVNTIADLQALDTSGLVDRREAMVSGVPFKYDGANWKPSDGYVTPEAYGETGTADDTAVVQLAIDSGYNLKVNNRHIVTSLDFTSFQGIVYGSGEFAAKGATYVPELINMTGASYVQWQNVDIDMSQTITSTASDPICVIGFFMNNARDISIQDVEIKNVREGRPIAITGSSSTAPAATDGSKRIKISRVTCIAFPYNEVDVGTYCYVRSDFYTSNGGGIYFGASNGVKVSDMLLDDSVAYLPTTTDIWFTDCHFENHDRFALLNCSRVTFTGNIFKNFNTRGVNASPAVSNLTWNGGLIEGGAAAFNVNYACFDIQVSNAVLNSTGPTGEKKLIGVGCGSERVSFSNISGIMGAAEGITLNGCKSVSFSNIVLQDYFESATTQGCIVLKDYASSYLTEDICFASSSFARNATAGTAPNRLVWSLATAGNIGNYAPGFLTLRDVKTANTGGVFVGLLPSGGLVVSGLDSLSPDKWAGNSSGPDPEFCMFYDRNTLQMQMHDSVSLNAATTFPTFPTMWYWAPERVGGGGDAGRNPSVTIYRERDGDFMPLIYGVHWFVEGTEAGKMQDRIRMYDPGRDTVSGDVIHILRHA